MCFEQCCAVTYGVWPSKVIIIQSALADILRVRLSLRDHQHQHLLRAKSVLGSAIGSVEGRWRLPLSLSGVHVRQGGLHEAKAILEGLLNLFNRLKSPDIVDRLGHVRLHMTMARSCPPEQSRSHWREALRVKRGLQSSSGKRKYGTAGGKICHIRI